MGKGKIIGYCLLFVFIGIAIGLGVAFYMINITQEVVSIIPGFDVVAFIVTIILIFPITILLIRRQLIKIKS